MYAPINQLWKGLDWIFWRLRLPFPCLSLAFLRIRFQQTEQRTVPDVIGCVYAGLFSLWSEFSANRSPAIVASPLWWVSRFRPIACGSKLLRGIPFPTSQNIIVWFYSSTVLGHLLSGSVSRTLALAWRTCVIQFGYLASTYWVRWREASYYRTIWL